MKIFVSISILFLLSLPAFADQAALLRVVDGDTIYVTSERGEKVKVRLYGIDCPESKQPGGAGATAFVRNHITQTVDIQVMDHDRYNRTVAMVILEDGTNLNEEIIRAGFAWVYGRYCRKSFCSDWENLESKARESGLGVWNGSPIPPWEWRRLH